MCSKCTHHTRTVEERFWEKVGPSGTADCWPWTGGVNSQGYSALRVGKMKVYAHRWIYAHWFGSIPAGLTIDHLCRKRTCVNPTHMEVVTRGENVLRGISIFAQNARKTHCLRGHPFDEANTRLVRKGRQCRICAERAWRKRYAATKALP